MRPDNDVYNSERQMVFEAVVGKRVKETWRGLPLPVQVLIALTVVSRDPDKYLDEHGYLKGSFSSTMVDVIGYDRRPRYSSSWTEIAARRMWVQNDGGARTKARLRILPSDDLLTVLADVKLYYQESEALSPAGWTEMHQYANELFAGPVLNKDKQRAAALAYVLARIADASQP